jgi:pimeloyl-ACP methyl ester carboxylesterase
MGMSAEQIVRWQLAKKDLLLPIIYLRGFAMTQGEIDDTTADPFNGFNVGSVLVRTGWTGDSARHIFESPVLRLTQPPFNYRVSFSDGVRGLGAEAKKEVEEWAKLGPVQGGASGSPQKAVIAIYRYYDIDSHLFGEGATACMETYGWGLARLIVDVLDATRADGIYLVAHSMGGLVARTFLQNEQVLDGTNDTRPEKFQAIESLIQAKRVDRLEPDEWSRARRAVRQFFTYGTPHNGITGQGGAGNALVGAIGALVGFQIDNFDRGKIKEYLGDATTANSLDGKFDIERSFCLIGTGSADYPVAGGLSRRLVGQLSDGLVEVDNAFVCGPKPGGLPDETVLAARAYVRRAHSGPYGMVNSEEGFGNLSRFLFGDARVDGDLRVDRIDLPPELMKQQAAGNSIRASYSFESFLRVRGENWAMNERLARDGAAVFRRYDELFPEAPLPSGLTLTAEQARKKRLHRRIELFTAFLDTQRRTEPDRIEKVEQGKVEIRGTMGFALRLRIAVPDYEVDGVLWRKDHYEGSALLDVDLVFLAYQDANGWQMAWGPNTADSRNLTIVKPAGNAMTTESATEAFRRRVGNAIEFWLPLNETKQPEVRAWLHLVARQRSPAS